MRKFDYSFLNNGLLPANLINLTSSIASLKTMAGVRKEEYAKVFTELEAVAKVQSVKSSNAIEGIVTSDERIAAIVNQDSAPLNHTEGEIAGYRDALNAIHIHHDTLDLRQNDILRLHEMMMQIAGYEYGGQYKTGDNYIIEEDSDGNRKVRFKPTPASEVKEAMEQLELAYMEARNNANINQLLLIPCVVLDFLCIHPFRDGNGRMSRLLSLLLLYKNGYDAGKYVSFEEQINNYKAYYYEALRESSVGWHENRNSYIPFIENFLSTLYMCYKELDKRFAVIHGKKITKTAYDIIKIFPNVFPKSFIDTLCNLNYFVNDTEQLYKIKAKINNKADIHDCLSKYINENWKARRNKNMIKRSGGKISLIKESVDNPNETLSCDVTIKKTVRGLRMDFMVSNNDFFISNIDNYDTQASDGVHLLLCGTEKYSYNSIFFFPKKIDGKIKVVPCDVLNGVNKVLNDDFVTTQFQKTDSDYTITAIFSNKFIEKHHLNSYFYMGMVISDCSSETQYRKNQLIL